MDLPKLNSLNWQTAWSVVGTGIFPQFNPVTSIATSSGEIALFAVGSGSQGNAVYTNWGLGNKWQDNWVAVGSGIFSEYTPVAAVFIPGLNQINLFAIGQSDATGSNKIYTNWGIDGNWQENWLAVGSDDFSALTQIAAVIVNNKEINLFALNENAEVYTNVGINGFWSANWSSVGGNNAGPFQYPTTVTAIVDGAGEINLFAVGATGKALTIKQYNGSWQNQNWYVIGSSNKFNINTTIAATVVHSSEIFLFAVGANGAPYVLGYNGFWPASWLNIGSQQSFVTSAPLAATVLNPNQLYVFGVNGSTDGNICADWQSNGSWNQQWALIGNGIFASDSQIAVAVSSSQINLFAIGLDGALYTNWSN